MANLLRVDIYELTDALTQKSMILRGEEIQSPLSVEQVGQLGDVYIIYIYIARQSAATVSFLATVGELSRKLYEFLGLTLMLERLIFHARSSSSS